MTKTILNRFRLRYPTSYARRNNPKVVEAQTPLREQKNKGHRIGVLVFLVAEVGFEPHDLRVMSPTSYQAALLRDMIFCDTPYRLVPVTGVEPVRY